MNDSKATLREAILKARNSLSKDILVSMSEMIQARVLGMDEFISAKTVGGYHPLGSEVSTLNLLSSALQTGKRVALPRVEDETRMVFAEIRDLENDLEAGRYKIMEPRERCPRVDNLDILLLPGVAWDLEGYRLGYGKGYYDRYLASTHASVKRVGLAYDFQVLESMQHGSDDLRVDMIVTERRVVEP